MVAIQGVLVVVTKVVMQLVIMDVKEIVQEDAQIHVKIGAREHVLVVVQELAVDSVAV